MLGIKPVYEKGTIAAQHDINVNLLSGLIKNVSDDAKEVLCYLVEQYPIFGSIANQTSVVAAMVRVQQVIEKLFSKSEIKRALLEETLIITGCMHIGAIKERMEFPKAPISRPYHKSASWILTDTVLQEFLKTTKALIYVAKNTCLLHDLATTGIMVPFPNIPTPTLIAYFCKDAFTWQELLKETIEKECYREKNIPVIQNRFDELALTIAHEHSMNCLTFPAYEWTDGDIMQMVKEKRQMLSDPKKVKELLIHELEAFIERTKLGNKGDTDSGFLPFPATWEGAIKMNE